MKKMSPVVHFQLPADDPERMSAFYSGVFGWETKQLGPEMGGYMTVMTTESDEKGPKEPGAINGGFFKKTADPKSHLMNVVIAVDDIEDRIKQVKAAGGSVTEKPEMIPGVGMFVMFTDTEGNRICMIQPIEM